MNRTISGRLKLKDVVRVVEAEVLCGEDLLEREISDYAASDLLSDVLAVDKENYLLLTGLNSLQVVRTAELTGAVAVLLVRHKPPTQEALGLARSHRIPLMMTSLTMFEAVKRIVSEMSGREGAS